MRIANALAALIALLSLLAALSGVPYAALVLVLSAAVFVVTERRLPLDGWKRHNEQ